MPKLYLCSDFDETTCDEDKKLIPHIKRFMECLLGDETFYKQVIENPNACGQLLNSRGITGVDPNQILSMFSEFPNFKDLKDEDLKDMPQALLWKRWFYATAAHREHWKRIGDETPNQNFNHWHLRQKKRCYSQMSSGTNDSLVHATIAFELSSGCSMQCSFCGLATKPLQKVFLYTEDNRKLWQDVLKVAKNHLGETMRMGICYWGTEPSDNKDYLKFLLDFEAMTGVFPQTTTAAALRDLNWTRSLLDTRLKHPTSADRFSLLSEGALHRVHENFTAEALILTELILQYSTHLKKNMAYSGRNLNRQDLSGYLKDHTIACVTGYLINMAEKSIKLISPCPPSEDHPLGYIIFDERKFASATDVDDFMSEAAENIMISKSDEFQSLAFRKSLEFKMITNGFQLKSPYMNHKMSGKPYLEKLGLYISQGNMTESEIVDLLMLEYPDPLAIIASIQKLKDNFLLQDSFIDF